MSILGRFLNNQQLQAGDGMERRTLTSSSFVPPPAVGVIDDYVGVHRAMANMTVFACVRLLADTIASLPWKAYRRDSKGVPKEVKPQPQLISQPYPGFDLFEWKWMTVASMALRGNAYSYVAERDKQGYPTAMLPLHPDIVFLERQPDLLKWFEPIYRIMGEAVDKRDMVHMRRFTMPGEPWGMSPIRQAAVAIGLGLSAEEYGYRFYKESATPSGTLSTEQDLDPGAITTLQQNWIQSHGGRRLPAILTKGFKFEPISLRPDESQFLECVVPGTLFTMADGTRMPVEELRVGHRVMAWNGSKLEAAPVAAVGTPPVKPLVKITTARGRELICTEDHPVLGLPRLRTAGGRPLPTHGHWIAAGALQAGNYVRVGLGDVGESGDLNGDIAYFLGAMVGDGYIRSAACAWSSSDEAVTARMSDAVRALGGELRYKDGYDHTILTGGSGRAGSVIRGILNESGLVGAHSHDKFVPEMIMAGGRTAWREFLSAYFDADGSIRDSTGKQKPAAYWASTSRELLGGCQHLLALLGINSSIYPMGKPGPKAMPGGYISAARPSWGLYVMGNSELSKLGSEITPAHPEKSRRLAAYRDAAPSRYRAVNFEYDAVKTVEHLGEGQTVGVEIAGLHTHVTGGLITHNTRQFQRSEICLLYGVPPILIGDTKETTAWGTGVSQITLGAVTYTFRPWTSLIESIISAQLPRGQFVRFDYNALLRGDVAARYETLKTGIQSTLLTPNEARASEEMDPVENGDQLLVAPNYLPLGAQLIAAVGGGVSKPPTGGTAPKKPKMPGTLPMPPVGGGENHGSEGSAQNGHRSAPEEPFATYRQELRAASREYGKTGETLISEECDDVD